MISRFFTTENSDVLDSIQYLPVSVENFREETVSIFVPEDWSLEAASAITEAISPYSVTKKQLVEENTLPSWLWKHKQITKSKANFAPEISVKQLFSRIVGAATYIGWKKGLWKDENEALAFYEEVFFLLAKRFVSLDPKAMQILGADWAYGAALERNIKDSDNELTTTIASRKPNFLSLRNRTIDSIIKNETLFSQRWQKFLRGGKVSRFLSLEFADTAAEWCQIINGENAPQLMIDLFRFRKDDGSFDIAAFRQTIKLSVFLLELLYDYFPTRLHPARPLSIGYCNLGALLVSMALPYNSTEGRATAAAISAIMTAEALLASSQIAQALGPCIGFLARREECLRTARNYRQAVYGECSDYERISILPSPLFTEDGADLVLVAAARRSWDLVVEKVHKTGLRHLRITELFQNHLLFSLLDCSSQGIDPETQLVRHHTIALANGSLLSRYIHPAVPLALKKTEDSEKIQAVVNFVVGYGTLKSAPGVNHDLLRKKGFTDEAITKIESYLPYINDIRTAFTPWILGQEFCRKILRIPANSLFDPRFDMLRHLGFSEEDIAAANAWCCGHGSFTGIEGLSERALKLFSSDNASTEARIKMASAVQSFIMGDVNLVLSLPMQTDANTRANLFLSGWRHGLKSVKLYFEGLSRPATALKKAHLKSRDKLIARKGFPPVPTPVPSKLISVHSPKPKASAKTVGFVRQNRKLRVAKTRAGANS